MLAMLGTVPWSIGSAEVPQHRAKKAMVMSSDKPDVSISCCNCCVLSGASAWQPCLTRRLTGQLLVRSTLIKTAVRGHKTTRSMHITISQVTK